MFGQCDYCDNGCDRCRPDDSDYPSAELPRDWFQSSAEYLAHALVALGDVVEHDGGPPLTHGSSGMPIDNALTHYRNTKAEFARRATEAKAAKARATQAEIKALEKQQSEIAAKLTKLKS